MCRALNGKPHTSLSNSDGEHRRCCFVPRTLGLTAAGTMCGSNVSPGHYPKNEIPTEVCLSFNMPHVVWLKLGSVYRTTVSTVFWYV